MYINFAFNDGSNPYITANNKGLFDMVCKYILTQTGASSFDVEGEASILTIHTDRKLSNYQKKRLSLKTFAREWQFNFSDMVYSWDELIRWGAFFEEYGRKYGLLREFRENGIC